MSKPKRVVLKISGECLSGLPAGRQEFQNFGFDKTALEYIAHEVHDAIKSVPCELCIVVGSGNLIRGSRLIAQLGSTPVVADLAGMLTTVINGAILQDFLERTHDLQVRVMSALEVPSLAEPYIRRRALRHLAKGHLVIFAGGSGNPRFTTDSGAVLRAIELNADFVAKGTKVEGVYDRDPHAHRDAQFIDAISHHEFVQQGLGVMDRTAITLARENHMPIRVFNIFTKGNLKKILEGKKVGSEIVS